MEQVSPGSAGHTLLQLHDSSYPALLREISDPPRQLYLRGDVRLLNSPMLAIVGARRASVAGLQAAESLAAAAAAVGLTVCSGLALGVDAAAHRGALEAGGETVAVMGTGIDTLYPPRNRDLGEQIARAGCLVTEYPPGALPHAGNFPRRNRIISGLSLGVVVVEAAERSGSLITARLAGEQGREVFALPWSGGHGAGAGCLRLLRDGAKMVQSIDDVLEELPSLYAAFREANPRPEPDDANAGEHGASLLDLIGDAQVPADHLVELSGLPVAEVFAQLSQLELAGRVARGAGGYYRLG